MLSANAQKLMDKYFSLPFKGVIGVRCPYFNNTRQQQRGQLRVLVGKGTPEELVEEANIISIQYHAGLFEKDGTCCLHQNHEHSQNATSEEIRKFLIDHNLGIECSGFVTQILRAHYQEASGVDIAKKIITTSPKNIIRWLLAKLRPIENINVRVYAENQNTTKLFSNGPVDYSKVQTADIIVMLETGPNHKRNHILLITDIKDNVITYAHARAWASEGKYGHGVSKGTITITKPQGNLLEQAWLEKDLAQEKNETYLEAKNAAILEIRRIKI